MDGPSVSGFKLLVPYSLVSVEDSNTKKVCRAYGDPEGNGKHAESKQLTRARVSDLVQEARQEGAAGDQGEPGIRHSIPGRLDEAAN